MYLLECLKWGFTFFHQSHAHSSPSQYTGVPTGYPLDRRSIAASTPTPTITPQSLQGKTVSITVQISNSCAVQTMSSCSSVHLYFKCNCDRHKWKPAFFVHCSRSLTFTSTCRNTTHSSVSIVFCSQRPFIAVFIYMSLWSQHNIDNAIVCQWQNTQTGYSGTKWDCICFQTEAKAVKSEGWFFCLKQNVYNIVIAWQQSSTLVD